MASDPPSKATDSEWAEFFDDKAAPKPAPVANPHRVAGGRFAKGNPGGPGGVGGRVSEIRKQMLETLKPGDLTAILLALIKQAKSGDIDSSKLVLAYAVGGPDRVHDQVEAEARELAIRAHMEQTDSPPK